MPSKFCHLWRVAFLPFLLQSGIMAIQEIQGVVGENVTLSCPYNKEKTITFMYVQKYVDNAPQFLNGFHKKNPTTPAKIYENRTSLDKDQQHVTLKDLTPKDEGEIECIIQYDTEPPVSTKIRLIITASYSVPLVTVTQNARPTARQITCYSSRGYPKAEVVWDFQPNLTQYEWTEVNRTSIQDPDTGLFATSSIIVLNTSQAINVICTVGNSTSQKHTVCEECTTPPDTLLIVAYIIVAVLVIICGSMVPVKLIKSRSQRQDPEMGNSENPNELETLV